ncbi:hypothetical protein GOODEAATRI_023318, partial [Goodea atripinnis]
SFTTPEVKKEHTEENDESTYLCHSSGGYPEPVVYWLINNSQEPPNGSVRTQAEALPDSHLYNITSQLTVNIPKDATVSCTIKNPSMNEMLTSKCESFIGAVGSQNTPSLHSFVLLFGAQTERAPTL